MKQVTIEVPDEIVSLWGSVAAFAEGTKQVMVLDALRRRQISAGKAADLLGISLWDLHDLAAENQISMVEMTEEELKQELDVAGQVLSGEAQ